MDSTSTERRIRVLIVDDSAIVRYRIALEISRNPDIELVGSAKDGREAILLWESISPDVIVLDILMPFLDGVEVVTEIRKTDQLTQIIMCSSLAKANSEATADSMSAGANDYMPKLSQLLSPHDLSSRFGEQLISKIRLAAQRRDFQLQLDKPEEFILQSTPPLSRRGGINTTTELRDIPKPTPAPHVAYKNHIDALAIGASTGGPRALELVLRGIPSFFPVPIFIVQHFPVGYAKTFVERLNNVLPIQVREAVEGVAIEPGQIWLATGDFHMTVVDNEKKKFLSLDHGPRENSCRPSIDKLFRSMAMVYGSNCLAVVLTGMGTDGVIGCEAIKRSGGQVIAQDKSTSTIWGIPGAVVNANLADEILPISQISRAIVDRIRPRQLNRFKH